MSLRSYRTETEHNKSTYILPELLLFFICQNMKILLQNVLNKMSYLSQTTFFTIIYHVKCCFICQAVISKVKLICVYETCSYNLILIQNFSFNQDPVFQVWKCLSYNYLLCLKIEPLVSVYVSNNSLGNLVNPFPLRKVDVSRSRKRKTYSCLLKS